MTLLAAPFIGSMRHQMLKSSIKQPLIENINQQHTQKALWFTDTIDDLNGVSVTLRQIATHSIKHGYNLKLVTCVDIRQIKAPLPDNTINFTPINEIVTPGYNTQKIGFPSLLRMMKEIIRQQADQIIISTPGPLGLGAMLCAKLLNLPIKTVYHTDFAEQLMRIANEPMLAKMADVAVNAFYKQADTVFAPSQFYIDKLKASGFEERKLSIFPRGIDLDLYRPTNKPEPLIRRHQLHGDFTLLFAGRISEDKNLSLLSEIIKLANKNASGAYNLIIAGDGPDLHKLKVELATEKNVLFTGRIGAEELVEWYQNTDLLVFPSHTDTFGMVVLEAQACGVPCLVTTTGGPKEIIIAEQTGHIIRLDDPHHWFSKIQSYRNIKTKEPMRWKQLKRSCSEHVHNQNSWQPVFDAVLSNKCLLPNISSKKIDHLDSNEANLCKPELTKKSKTTSRHQAA